MKRSSFIVALVSIIYLGFDFYLNVGSYGHMLNKNGFTSTGIKTWQIGSLINDDESIYRLGMAYWAGKGVEENYDKAFGLLKEVQTLNPKLANFYEYALADIYIHKGNLVKAKKMLEVLCNKQLNEACTRLNQVLENEQKVGVRSCMVHGVSCQNERRAYPVKQLGTDHVLAADMIMSLC